MSDEVKEMVKECEKGMQLMNGANNAYVHSKGVYEE